MCFNEVRISAAISFSTTQSLLITVPVGNYEHVDAAAILAEATSHVRGVRGIMGTR